MNRAIVLIAVILVGFGIAINSESTDRATNAGQWSTPGHVTVSATGLLNKTLLLTPANPDPRICPLLVPSITSDTKLVAKIRAYGFTQLQCSTGKESLQ